MATATVYLVGHFLLLPRDKQYVALLPDGHHHNARLYLLDKSPDFTTAAWTGGTYTDIDRQVVKVNSKSVRTTGSANGVVNLSAVVGKRLPAKWRKGGFDSRLNARVVIPGGRAEHVGPAATWEFDGDEIPMPFVVKIELPDANDRYLSFTAIKGSPSKPGDDQKKFRHAIIAHAPPDEYSADPPSHNPKHAPHFGMYYALFPGEVRKPIPKFVAAPKHGKAALGANERRGVNPMTCMPAQAFDEA